ncbi:hypothetical protein PG994_013944 [Apiospora phragmitis]|uniref:RRM domain-containing protein n=1 Tax=Apiospora phragmitis TaxID=2905665 RepID=A0ABR1T2W6_9PEZI
MLALCDTEPHLSSPGSQQDSHPTLAALVADSTPIDVVKGTVDGVKQLDTTDGPEDPSIIIPRPPAFVHRGGVAAHQRVQAIRNASTNYGGNRLAPSNLSANIPEEQNCSMFVSKPASVAELCQLFAAFRGVGRFASAHINPPSGSHATAAVKVSL